MLVSLLPFVILLSAFASQGDDDICLRFGLGRRPAGIADHLITSAPATANAATITSLRAWLEPGHAARLSTIASCRPHV